jgi:hypothetical protein
VIPVVKTRANADNGDDDKVVAAVVNTLGIGIPTPKQLIIFLGIESS